MTAKEYLSQAHRLNERINSDLAELDSLRNLAVSISGGSFGERVQHSRDADPPYVKAVMKICDMEQKINTEIDRLIDLKSEISIAIGCLTNMDEQMLLRYRYINNYDWEKIAVLMSVSYRTCHRIHSSALKNFSVPA